jgi:cytosine/adenosine deaminase-related metal-dependent hydrolase
MQHGTSASELLRAARALAERRDVGTTIHLDQSHGEVESVMNVRGVRPAEYLFQHDFLSSRLVAAALPVHDAR